MHRREKKQGEKEGQNKKRERESTRAKRKRNCTERGEEKRGATGANKSQHFFCILIRAVLPYLCLNQTPGELCGSRHQQTEKPGLQSSDIPPLSDLRLKQLDTDHSLFHISSCNKVTSRPIKKLISCSMVWSRCATRADVNLRHCGT